MTTQTEDRDVSQIHWLDPFPEPQTIPAGWDLSGLFPDSRTVPVSDSDSATETESE